MEESNPLASTIRCPAKEGVDEDMFRAIVKCDLEGLRLALSAGARPTQLNLDGNCPLHLALYHISHDPYSYTSGSEQPLTPCEGHYDSDCNSSECSNESSEESSDCDDNIVSGDESIVHGGGGNSSENECDPYWRDDYHSDSSHSCKSFDSTKETLTKPAKKAQVIANIVELLLEQGANPNCIDKEGRTLLYQVIRFKSGQSNIYELESATKLLNLFFSYGVCWRYDGPESRFNSFSLALKRKNAQALRLFLEHGYQLDMYGGSLRRFRSWYPILKLDVFEILARAGIFQVNTKSKEGLTAFYSLITSFESSSMDQVKVMLDLGAKVNTIDYYPAGSLMYLAAENHELGDVLYSELMRLLVMHGGDLVENYGTRRPTPLAMVIRHGSWELTEWCIDRAIENGKTMDELNATCPLSEAVYYKEIFDGLILKGFDIQQKNEIGWTALHSAISADIYCAALLLQWGADVNSVDKWGFAPLHYSCRGGSDVHTDLLLSYGADINCRSLRNELPLDMMCHLKSDTREKVTKRIIEQIVIEESEGRPIDAQNRTPIIEYLSEFYNECQIEIALAQSCSFRDLFTYYELLTSNNLQYHIRNGFVYDATLSDILLYRFPIYGKRMNDRLLRAYQENAFVMRARKALNRIILGSSYNDLSPIYEIIMTHLSRADLANLGKI